MNDAKYFDFPSQFFCLDKIPEVIQNNLVLNHTLFGLLCMVVGYFILLNIIKKVVQSEGNEIVYDVVGPICETGDIMGKSVPIGNAELGDILVISSVGAYGAVMSSNYNTRPKAPEVIVSGNQSFLIRREETISQILQNEVIV